MKAFREFSFKTLNRLGKPEHVYLLSAIIGLLAAWFGWFMQIVLLAFSGAVFYFWSAERDKAEKPSMSNATFLASLLPMTLILLIFG